METRAHHVLIGLFTAIVVAGLLLFGLWLAGGGFERDADRYDIVFNEEVTGLSVGSSVLYNGIRVGDVERLALDHTDPRRAVARIRISPHTPIKQDTRAQLGVAGFLTGTAHIRLSGGSPESPPLLVDAEHIPVITAQPSPIARLRAESDVLMDGINSLVKRANELLSPENAERFSRTLDHIEQTTGVIAEQQDQIRAGTQALVTAGQEAGVTLQEATKAIQQANKVMQEAAVLLGGTNQLLDAHGEDILGSATRAMASVERSAASIEALLADNEEAFGGAMQGLGDIGPAIQDLRITLASLRNITRRIEDDPAGYLLGRDTIRGFEP